MPIYEFKCEQGHISDELMSFNDDLPEYITCPKCGNRAKHIISLPNTDMKENERWSEAMGVNVDQIPQAQKTFPGSEYHPETGALKINSRKHKLKEMKRRGYVEY